MTIARPPVSICAAVTTVAGRIGWRRAGQLLGRSERTVRRWSEPDSRLSVPLDDALRLDTAWAAAGGVGLPIFDTYARLAGGITCNVQPTRDALIVAVASVAKEGGEAVSAAAIAIAPGAGPRHIVAALVEAEQSHGATARLVTKLRKFVTRTGAVA